MILFFSAEEMGGSCTRVSYNDALRKFNIMTGIQHTGAWMSLQCMHDVQRWSRAEEEDVPPLDRPGFRIMVSVNLKDPQLYFGVEGKE